MNSRKITLVAVTSLILCYCSDKPKTRDFDSPDEFMDNPSLQDGVDESGQSVYLGDDPPAISGRYHAEGSVTDSVEYSLIGATVNSSICLYDQTYSGLINFAEVSGDTSANARGNFITGYSDRFTIWQEGDAYMSGCRQHNALLLSGQKLSNGDLRVNGLTIVLEADDCGSISPGFWYQTELYFTLECECHGISDLYDSCSSSSFCGDGSIDPGEECDDGNTANGDGCSSGCEHEYIDSWYDTETNLVWQSPATTERYTLNEAQNYCSTLSLPGHPSGEWRLPTISELRTLVKGCPQTEDGGSCGVTDDCLEHACRTGCGELCNELEGPSPSGCYWSPEIEGTCPNDIFLSSSLETESSDPWSIGFNFATIVMAYADYPHSVRCVRPGP